VYIAQCNIPINFVIYLRAKAIPGIYLNLLNNSNSKTTARRKTNYCGSKSYTLKSFSLHKQFDIFRGVSVCIECYMQFNIFKEKFVVQLIHLCDYIYSSDIFWYVAIVE
jgi:hypothetical protein